MAWFPIAIFWLLKLMYVIWYFDSEIVSDSISEHLFFKHFLEACSQTPLALACYACMLIVLHTITYPTTHYTKDHTLTMYVPLIRENMYTFLDPLVCQMCACFQEDHTTCLPPISYCTLFWPPLAKILKYIQQKVRISNHKSWSFWTSF